MNIEISAFLKGEKLNIWKTFLKEAHLEADENVKKTVLVWEDSKLIACGSIDDDILKCIAVKKERQGEGLTATVISALKSEAFKNGKNRLFLYTKPKNEMMFASLFFYPIAKTDKVLLMEDKKNGISDFLDSLPVIKESGNIGALVVNCNPFTLGHRYIIEKAASECDFLYVFVLSENKSEFSALDRMEMVRLGTVGIENIAVYPTGDYLISQKTFPAYFLKDRDSASIAQCELDIEIFAKYFATRFNITRRYVGTEPFSALTAKYNDALIKALPQKNIEVREIARFEKGGKAVSASDFRQLLREGKTEEAKKLVPKSTFDYLTENKLINSGGKI